MSLLSYIRRAYTALFAHQRNETSIKKRTHLYQRRRLPRPPNRVAHRMSRWREVRDIL